MEHVVSKRITNVKKLTAWQKHLLEVKARSERYDKIGKALNVALIILGFITLYNFNSWLNK